MSDSVTEVSLEKEVRRFTLGLVESELHVSTINGVSSCEIIVRNDPEIAEANAIAAKLLSLCLRHKIPVEEIAAICPSVVRSPIAYAIRAILAPKTEERPELPKSIPFSSIERL